MRRRTIDLGNCTVVEYAYARTGSVLKASRCVAYLTLYSVCREDLDLVEPTTEEYAEWAGESKATAYRHAALWREVFGRSPASVLDAFAAQGVGVQERHDLSGLVLA